MHTTWTQMESDPSTGREFRFPIVTLDNGMTWETHHTVSEGCDQIDAYLITDRGEKLGLDMWGYTAFAEDSCDDDELVAAIAEWDAGGVHHGSYGLIIPDPVIEHFEEALRRWFRP